VSKHDRPVFILVEKFYFSEGIIMNRKGRLALILLMFFVLVGCDLFGTTSTTTQAVTTQTTTTRVTTTTRITTTALPTTTVVTTDSPLTVQL